MLEDSGYSMKVAENSDDNQKVAVAYKQDLAEYVMTETLSSYQTTIACHFIIKYTNKHFVFINGLNDTKDTEALKTIVPKSFGPFPVFVSGTCHDGAKIEDYIVAGENAYYKAANV